MFRQYIPFGLEPPTYRIAHRIQVVLSTYEKVEPPIPITASMFYPSFFYSHESWQIVVM